MSSQSTDSVVTIATDDSIFQFLQTQSSYVTSHFQIADAKAAGNIAYVSVLIGYTTSKVNLSAGPPYSLTAGLALVGTIVGLFAIVSAFVALMPRAWPGGNPGDLFSWVGLSSSKANPPYAERIPLITAQEMQSAIADTVETCSRILRRKYQLIYIAMLLTIVATAFIFSSWAAA